MQNITEPQVRLLKNCTNNNGIRWHSLSGSYMYANGAGGIIRKSMVKKLIRDKLLKVEPRKGFAGSSDYFLVTTF